MTRERTEIIMLTQSAPLLHLGKPDILDCQTFDPSRLPDLRAVLVEPDLDASTDARIRELCQSTGITVFYMAEPMDVKAVESSSEPIIAFMGRVNALGNPATVAPENLEKIELSTLVDIITTANSLLEPNDVMQTVMARINDLVQCEAWSVLIVDEEEPGMLKFAAAFGPNSQSLFNQKVPIGEGIAGWVAEKGEPIIVNHVKRDPRHLNQFDQDTRFATRNILCAPLSSRGRTIGVIEMLNRKQDQGFSNVDLELVQILVNPAAVAIENAFLFQQTQMLTVQDDLTKLYNSRYLNKCLDFELQRAKRVLQPLSILFLDLDYFKHVNDRYGHLQGSQSLVQIGKIIKAAARKIDIVGRYGGDEFMLVLPATGPKGALAVAERIRKNVASYQLKELRMTASIGIASYPEHGDEKDVLIRMADKAMYWVKDHGKNGIALAGLEQKF